ncbi:MAG: hypothetical protein GTN76_03505 [Candidatus Aenigmarchaeota archaeon]|nr:hypothetical protein [Candidatus Aenigmarchaeota archaeon]
MKRYSASSLYLGVSGYPYQRGGGVESYEIEVKPDPNGDIRAKSVRNAAEEAGKRASESSPHMKNTGKVQIHFSLIRWGRLDEEYTQHYDCYWKVPQNSDTL